MWFYKSKKLVYGEHLIINSFIFSQSFLILIFLTPFVIIFPSITSSFPFITIIVLIGYFSYALNSTFEKSPIRSVLASFFSLFVGYMIFLVSFIFIVFLVVVIIIITK